MPRDWRKRAPPARTPEQWAREFFVAAGLKNPTGPHFERLTRAARQNDRLRERLPAAIAKIAQQSARAAGLPLLTWLRVATGYSGFLVIKQATVRRCLRDVAKELGIDKTAALRHAQKNPMLFCLSEGTLAARRKELQRLTGLSEEECHICIRRSPALLTFTIKALERHMREHLRILLVDTAEYRKLLLREPRLLVRSPETIRDFLDGVVRLWKREREIARAFVIKTPKVIVSGRMETMDANLTKLAKGFGIDKAVVVAAAITFPPIVYQKPERLIAAMKDGASVLQVRPQVLITAALRVPSLFVRKQEGWRIRMRLILRIARALGAKTDAQKALQTFPQALTYGYPRLLQRYAMARLGLWTWNWPTLLTFSDAKIRRSLNDYFAEHPERAALRQALQRRSLL